MSKRISRRSFLAGSAAAALGGSALSRGANAAVKAAAPRFDILIQGGMLLDGTGAAAFPADIGIRGDRIEAIGTIGPEQAAKVIQAAGLHVSPGFIDIHTHSDGLILVYPGADSRVRQGVTTELAGNCGGSAAPLSGADVKERSARMLEEDGVRAEWSDTAGYFACLEKAGMAINQALLTGHNTLRQNAIGMADRDLSADEMKGVVYELEKALDQGSMGLSSGLEYLPGSYAPPGELTALAQVVARRGGLYATHMRDEGEHLLEAVSEALATAKASGVRLEISHLKAAGRPNWDKQQPALDLISSARARGVQVMADAYPYPAYSTGLPIYLPAWAGEGGESALYARLADKSQRERIREAVNQQIALDPGEFSLIVIAKVWSDKNRDLIGKNLQQIADSRGVEPAELVLQLIEEEQSKVDMIGFGMRPENVELVLSHPLVMLGSDGYSIAPTGKMEGARPHPRSYGAFARLLGYYCRERKLFDLPTAVRKITSTPAEQIGLKDRGRLARGMAADLVLFDAATVVDTATFDDPQRYAKGVEYVLVNGRLAVERGQSTPARAGRVLRRV